MFSWSSLLPVFHTICFPSHLLLSHMSIVETMDSRERGNNLSITLIDRRKENSRGSNHRMLFFRSCALPAERHWLVSNVHVPGGSLVSTLCSVNFFSKNQLGMYSLNLGLSGKGVTESAELSRVPVVVIVNQLGITEQHFPRIIY